MGFFGDGANLVVAQEPRYSSGTWRLTFASV
jgi:hypothetical protein